MLRVYDMILHIGGLAIAPVVNHPAIPLYRSLDHYTPAQLNVRLKATSPPIARSRASDRAKETPGSYHCSTHAPHCNAEHKKGYSSS